MAIDLAFRRKAVRTLTNEIGCYVLCDLDQVPIYVGQSVDGIRSRIVTSRRQEATSLQIVRLMCGRLRGFGPIRSRTAPTSVSSRMPISPVSSQVSAYEWQGTEDPGA